MLNRGPSAAMRETNTFGMFADPAGDFVNGLASAVALVGETFKHVSLPGLLPRADAVTAEDIDRTR